MPEDAALYNVPPEELAEVIRPAGYYQLKTKRLRNLLRFLIEEHDGSLESMLEEFMTRRYERARFVIESSRQISAWEQEQWQGIKNPAARPGELLHEATLALMQPY